MLLPLLAGLVAGDIVAAEDGTHTLKTVLTRSTSRLRLLAAKAGATATYVVTILIVFGASGTLIGALAAGARPVTLGGSLGTGLLFAHRASGSHRSLAD